MKYTYLLLTVWLGVVSAAWAQNPLLIKITGSGNAARFVVEGGGAEPPVITMGQTVRWQNDDPSVRHSARSMATGPNGQRVFDTRFILVGQSSQVIFDADKFQAAGVPAGGEFLMEYQCEIHQGMRGFLKLKSSAGPGPGPGPTPAPTGNTVTFEAISDGTNQLFRPAQQAVLQVGDEIVWRNAATNPGLHALTMKNWAQDKEFLQVVSSEVDFNAATGLSGETDRGGAVFLRAKLIKLPPNPSASVDFYCTVHGPDMGGRVIFRKETEIKTVPMPEYRVPGFPLAAFDAVRIGEKPADSYFAMAVDVNGDGRKDLVTSGLGRPGIALAEVDWYENPTWQRHVIGRFDVPVALDAADVDGDGNLDLAICYDYGLCIIDCKPENGTIGWLRNPGLLQGDPEWHLYPIGKLMATHRLHFGHFSQKNKLELLAVPVVGGAKGDIHAPIKTMIFTRPAKPMEATGWKGQLVNDKLRVIHEISTGHYDAESGLDSILTASEEGITWLHTREGEPWQALPIGQGETGQVNASAQGWKGTGAVNVGKFRDDSLAFVASTEPFHGNIFAVYTKSTRNSLHRLSWERRVVDVFGPLSNRGEGPGHDVVTADIDGDGNDEILVGMRGPAPYAGVQLYKVQDLQAGKFLRQQVSSASAAQVVVDDFDNDGRPDFATIPYRVLTYYESEDTSIMLYLNRTPQGKARAGASKH